MNSRLEDFLKSSKLVREGITERHQCTFCRKVRYFYVHNEIKINVIIFRTKQQPYWFPGMTWVEWFRIISLNVKCRAYGLKWFHKVEQKEKHKAECGMSGKRRRFAFTCWDRKPMNSWVYLQELPESVVKIRVTRLENRKEKQFPSKLK